MARIKFAIAGITVIGMLLVYIAYQSKTSEQIYQNNLDYQEFLKFTNTFNKNYEPTEHLLRFQIFNSNLKTIHTFNTITKDFKLASNKFADLTLQEFTDFYSMPPIPLKKYPNIDPYFFSSFPLSPTAQDWRDEGAVTDVMNQGPDCKSSWAIAAVGAIESALVAQALLPLADLSVQQILDCDTGSGDHGCVGGLIDDAYLFAETNGLTTDVIYPYVGNNQTCKQVFANQTVTNITSFFDVLSFQSSYLITAVARTPCSSGVEVHNYVWQFYYSGIITGFCGNNITHYVLVVGYNQTATTPYYIAKNSWGPEWGESGYVRLQITGGAGMCGIQSLSSYPIVT